MIIYPKRQFSFQLPAYTDPLIMFANETYDKFSSLSTHSLGQEQELVSRSYKGYTLVVKINKLGYLIAELKSNMSSFPLQELIVKASPEFQRGKANLELRDRIRDAIKYSIEDVVEGLLEKDIKETRQQLFESLLDKRNLILVENLDDGRLGNTKLVDSLDYLDISPVAESSAYRLVFERTERPLVALGAKRVFVFEKVAA